MKKETIEEAIIECEQGIAWHEEQIELERFKILTMKKELEKK